VPKDGTWDPGAKFPAWQLPSLYEHFIMARDRLVSSVMACPSK
jgi:hypothetical protein